MAAYCRAHFLSLQKLMVGCHRLPSYLIKSCSPPPAAHLDRNVVLPLEEALAGMEDPSFPL